MKPIVCPECGSETVQKLGLAYAAGTVHSSGTTVSVGAAISRGGPALISGLSSSHQTQRSVLAKRSAPPTKKKEDHSAEAMIAGATPIQFCATGILVLLGFSAWNSNVIIAIMLMVFAGLFWYFHGRAVEKAKKKIADIEHYNSVVWPAEYERWENSWLCHKCGYVGIITLSKT